MSPDDAAKIAAQIAVKHAENVRILATAYPFRSLPGLVEIAQTSLAADIASALRGVGGAQHSRLSRMLDEEILKEISDRNPGDVFPVRKSGDQK